MEATPPTTDQYTKMLLQKNRKIKSGSTIFWSIFAAAAAIRIAASFSSPPIDAAACLRSDVAGIGTVAEDPERKESGQVLIIDTTDATTKDGTRCGARILIKAKTKLYPRYSYGDHVEFEGKLAAPRNFRSDNGRSFDYVGYLAKDDIYYEMKSAKVSRAATAARGHLGLRSMLYWLKHRFVSNLERSLGEPHSALAAGLVVGEKSALGKDLLNDFRIVGLIHIVVLSGFNITIVAVALRRMLSFLPRVWGIVIGGAGIALFGVLVGGGATVVRSCFMASVALIADLIRRDYSVVRALGFAALIMLIQNPLILLHDPSFQLSFLATLGLILLAQPLEEKLSFIPERFGMRCTVATSFATQIFVSPFILWMMGQISIIGVIVNILVLPFIPVTMLAVFLTGALGFVHPALSTVAGWFAHLLLSYELFMVEAFARVPYASLSIPPFSFWWVVGFYAAFIFVYIWMKKQ